MSEFPEDRYSVRVEWSEIDGEFKATCPAFPGLSAFGETREEAMEEANVALSMFIEDYQEEEDDLPAPQEAKQYSGQTRLRMPKWLHRELSEEAERQGTSLNSLLVSYLAKQCGRDEVLGQVTSMINSLQKTLRQGLTKVRGAGTSTTFAEGDDRPYQDHLLNRIQEE